MTTAPSTGVRSFPRVGVKATRRATIIAFFAWLFAVYDYILFGTLLPEIGGHFGWSDSTASLVSTLVSVGTAVVALAVGPIVDRIGRRRGMILTVSGTAVASALSAATPGAGYLVGVRAFGGLGLSEQAVNATYLNEIYAVTEDEKIKKRRGLIYSLVQGGWPLGVLLASAFVAIFLPLVGWRGCFLLAVFPAVVIALARRGLKESPQFELEQRLRALRKQGKADEAAALAGEYGVSAEPSAPLAAIFKGAALRNTLVLGFAWLVNWFGIQVFSVLGTTVLTAGKGVSFTGSLVMLIVINAIGYLGYVFHGWIGDRFGRRNVIAIGWLISGVLFTLTLTVASGTVAVVTLYSLGMFFLIGPYAALLFYMGECYDTRCRATGTAFLNALSQPGAILAGVITTAMLASGSNWNTAALLVGAVGTFASGLVMFAARKVKTLEA
ncbi:MULTISPECIES: MFS transporter [Amycolatopsis]|uniref:Predicted arabinose efflux permease, MFS family n=2 Tax=Amycolatopsis TaxID=1813 RepID=A0A1I4CEP4_9PSEU|nr:MFS transporter [Amycolatopsis sacchari]SFK79678.1 Predicted arabinose efflux permease, MFS family [Amycolatopsis sacchari]